MLMPGRPWILREVTLGVSRALSYDVAVLPWGATEGHNYHLPFGTDTIQAEAVAAEAAGRAWERGARVVVLPAIPMGANAQQLTTPVTLDLSPSTQAHVLADVVASLEHHDIRKLVILNGHGGNIATIQAAFAEIYSDISLEAWQSGRPIRCTSKNWWDGEGVSKLGEKLYGDDEGQHATCSEVSLTQFAYPESIKNVNFESRAPAYSGIHDADDYRRRYPDGRIGSLPSLSTPEHGRQFYELAVKDLAVSYRKFLDAA